MTKRELNSKKLCNFTLFSILIILVNLYQKLHLIIQPPHQVLFYTYFIYPFLVVKKTTITPEPILNSPAPVITQPPPPKEEKPKIYKPGSRLRKDPQAKIDLGQLIQDESEFPTL